MSQIQTYGITLFVGMRANSQVLVYVDVPKAMGAGLKFYLSANGVVLTEGNENGFIPTELFERVEFVTTNKAPSLLPEPEMQS